MAASKARPTAAPVIMVASGRLAVAMTRTARKGKPVRVKRFQIPVTRVYRTKSAVLSPQLDSMAQLTPTATAPPAGKVLATALEPRLTAAAWRSPIQGSTARIVIQ